MKESMPGFNAQCSALMRIVTGFLPLARRPEALRVPTMHPGVPPFITYIAWPIELFGGILAMIGLFTHGSAFLASLMAFAYWIGHGTTALLPIQNQGNSQRATVSCSSSFRPRGPSMPPGRVRLARSNDLR